MDDQLSRIITQAERDAVMAPIAEAMSLPAQAYAGDVWFALEVERVFAPNWTGVLFACEMPEPGDVKPFDLFDMPLVAMRGGDGRLRVFHNIVPYDGCLAVLSERNGLTEIETYYHGLVYDLAGKLIRAPYWNTDPNAGPEALEGRVGDLTEIRSEVRLGVLFINLDGGAREIDDWLAPWRNLVSGEYAIDRLVPGRDAQGKPQIERRTVQSNWKTYQENASINLLHEGFTHELYRKSPEVPRVSEDGTPRFELTMEGSLVAFAHSREMSGQTYPPIVLPTAGHDITVEPDWGYFTTLYPNINVPVLDAFMKVNIAIPVAPGVTELQHLRFYAPEAVAHPDFQAEDDAVQDLFDVVHHEDKIAIEAVQSARRSPVWRQHYYAPFWDDLHCRFNQLVMADMERE
ncbi:MAG: aromatic ring-hydroxylating oxygenase subunit alpha [Alphaproteobacteria bacterium]